MGSARDPARSLPGGQLRSRKSLHRQHPELAMVVIESTPRRQGADPGDLLNAFYDYRLEGIPFGAEPAGNALARSLHVTTLPTTFLLGSAGELLERWEGCASPGSLALRIETAICD